MYNGKFELLKVWKTKNLKRAEHFCDADKMEVADFLTSKSEKNAFSCGFFSCSSSKLIDVINSASVFTFPIQLLICDREIVDWSLKYGVISFHKSMTKYFICKITSWPEKLPYT